MLIALSKLLRSIHDLQVCKKSEKFQNFNPTNPMGDGCRLSNHYSDGPHESMALVDVTNSPVDIHKTLFTANAYCNTSHFATKISKKLIFANENFFKGGGGAVARIFEIHKTS